jgi:hypothetical protein
MVPDANPTRNARLFGPRPEEFAQGFRAEAIRLTPGSSMPAGVV